MRSASSPVPILPSPTRSGIGASPPMWATSAMTTSSAAPGPVASALATLLQPPEGADAVLHPPDLFRVTTQTPRHSNTSTRSTARDRRAPGRPGPRCRWSSSIPTSNRTAWRCAFNPPPKDALTLRHAPIRADELRGPIKFEQATRVEPAGGTASVMARFTDAHPSDDLLLEVSRIVDRNTSLTAGVSVSCHSVGFQNVTVGHALNWTGGFIHVDFDF